GPLEQPRACIGGLAGRAEGPTAGDLLEHDPAASLAMAILEQVESRLDTLRRLLCGSTELLDRERRRGDDEQRLERPPEPVERVGGNQAERTVHAELLSTAARAILIGANGAAWLISTSPCFRSSSSARNATATSVRGRPPTSWSKSNTRRRSSNARKRPTKGGTA